MKRCPRCKQEKPIDDFGNNRRTPDGKNYYCRECVRKRSFERQSYHATWREMNRDHVNQKSQEWAAANKEKRREISKRSYQKHREAALEKKRKYYSENKEKYAEWDRDARKKNPHVHLAAKSRYMARKHGCEVIPYDRKAVYERDKGQCRYCGKATKAVDHVMPLSRGGADSFENVVLCCHSCNVSKSNRTLDEWRKNGPRQATQDHSEDNGRKGIRGNRRKV